MESGQRHSDGGSARPGGDAGEGRHGCHRSCVAPRGGERAEKRQGQTKRTLREAVLTSVWLRVHSLSARQRREEDGSHQACNRTATGEHARRREARCAGRSALRQGLQGQLQLEHRGALLRAAPAACGKAAGRGCSLSTCRSAPLTFRPRHALCAFAFVPAAREGEARLGGDSCEDGAPEGLGRRVGADGRSSARARARVRSLKE